MPFIRISIGSPTLREDQVRALQSETTDLMAKVLGKKIPVTSVLVHHTPSAAWSLGGEPASLCAHVEATITAGTNSAEEKSRFIAEQMAVLRRVLGRELGEATYVVVQEISANAWGYGGKTQEERARLRVAA